jgi:hypothetical protein
MRTAVGHSEDAGSGRGEDQSIVPETPTSNDIPFKLAPQKVKYL